MLNSEELSELGLDIPEISQMGLVVENLQDGMDRYSAFGVSPWKVYRFEPPRLTDTTYRGEPREYSMLVALTDLAGTQIELITPLEGPNIYIDHLKSHGEGLHHIGCFALDEPVATVESFEQHGIPVLQSGNFQGIRYWYLDTAETLNGLIFETADLKGETLPEPDGVHP